MYDNIKVFSLEGEREVRREIRAIFPNEDLLCRLLLLLPVLEVARWEITRGAERSSGLFKGCPPSLSSSSSNARSGAIFHRPFPPLPPSFPKNERTSVHEGAREKTEEDCEISFPSSFPVKKQKCFYFPSTTTLSCV